jgi:hypothetical protein
MAHNTFAEQWKFESEIRELYPENFLIKYGEPYESKSGKTLRDWIVKDSRKTVAKHTMMILLSKKSGEPYAVVSVKPKPKPASAELKSILASYKNTVPDNELFLSDGE